MDPVNQEGAGLPQPTNATPVETPTAPAPAPTTEAPAAIGDLANTQTLVSAPEGSTNPALSPNLTPATPDASTLGGGVQAPTGLENLQTVTTPSPETAAGNPALSAAPVETPATDFAVPAGITPVDNGSLGAAQSADGTAPAAIPSGSGLPAPTAGENTLGVPGNPALQSQPAAEAKPGWGKKLLGLLGIK